MIVVDDAPVVVVLSLGLVLRKEQLEGDHIRFRERQESRLTFMVYLNDDVVGGETRFFRSMALALAGDPYLTVAPLVGAALVFEHAIWHEGAVVQAGRKYVLRTDVMYGRPPAP